MAALPLSSLLRSPVLGHAQKGQKLTAISGVTKMWPWKTLQSFLAVAVTQSSPCTMRRGAAQFPLPAYVLPSALLKDLLCRNSHGMPAVTTMRSPGTVKPSSSRYWRQWRKERRWRTVPPYEGGNAPGKIQLPASFREGVRAKWTGRAETGDTRAVSPDG